VDIVVTASVFSFRLISLFQAWHSCGSGWLGGGSAVACFACATDLKGNDFEWTLVIAMMMVVTEFA
jgi:hypothetical protein